MICTYSLVNSVSFFEVLILVFMLFLKSMQYKMFNSDCTPQPPTPHPKVGARFMFQCWTSTTQARLLIAGSFALAAPHLLSLRICLSEAVNSLLSPIRSTHLLPPCTHEHSIEGTLISPILVALRQISPTCCAMIQVSPSTSPLPFPPPPHCLLGRYKWNRLHAVHLGILDAWRAPAALLDTTDDVMSVLKITQRQHILQWE